MLTVVLVLFSALLLIIPTQSMLKIDTTDYPINKIDTSKAFEQTTIDPFLENDHISGVNESTMRAITSAVAITEISDSRRAHKPLSGRVVNSKESDTSVTQSNSSSGMNPGTIAGIVIGLIVLLCCLAGCGCCATKKSGHWEDAKVWVED